MVDELPFDEEGDHREPWEDVTEEGAYCLVLCAPTLLSTCWL